MKIITLTPRGYCKGVVNAINLAKKCAKEHPNTPISVLGMIVHNDYVVKALTQLNIRTLDAKGKTRLELLDEIDEGIVLFTAHGISDAVINKAKEKGLTLVDASCTDVVYTKECVKSKVKDGYEVLYIGKENHPEAEAILSISSQVHLITNSTSIEKLSTDSPLIYVTNQTTMSVLEVFHLIELIKEKFPHAFVEEEICSATRMRQEAVLNLSYADLLYVVGDPHSNNANKLKGIALENGIKQVELIETALDIKEKDLLNKEVIAITASASTPTYLTNQVIKLLEHYAQTQELMYPIIDLKQML